MTPRAVEVPTLSEVDAEAVRRLVRAAPGGLDEPALSERGLLHLQAPPPVRHFLLREADDADPSGYAQLDTEDGQPTAELVATDAAGASVLLSALANAADDPLVWAHGTNSVAYAAAESAGLQPVRVLLQLRRSLAGQPAAPVRLADGITIRAFRPGVDDAAWLAVNARAFAVHPEQGRWTQQDLQDRLSSDWFGPAGFLLAERDGRLLGFHWTKVHRDGPEPLGEVYVLGVDPAAQGLRLGTALLDAGLNHLRGLGLDTVLLYVEESNTTALRLYTGNGFREFARDLQYRRAPA